MIVGLSITLFVLILGLWLLSMFAWWKKESGIVFPLLRFSSIFMYQDKTARLARRAGYGGMLYLKQSFFWAMKKMSKLFYAVFPNAERAFTEKDELVGLKQGPSSYFLMSLSEEEKKKEKTRSVKRKVM